MDTRSLLGGLRYLDTFFPSGGFAFSSGLEAAVQAGAVCETEDVRRYVADCLWWGLGRCDAVALARAHRAARTGDMAGIIRADHEIESMKQCEDTRTASRQMGRSLLRNAVTMGGRDGGGAAASIRKDNGAVAGGRDDDGAAAGNIPDALREAVDAGRSPGHAAVVFGVHLQAAGWSSPDAVAGFLYQAGVGFVSASYKLLPIGQRDGQRLLASWIPLVADISRTVDADTPMTSWTPVQDIYAMRHARLTSRLFRS